MAELVKQRLPLAMARVTVEARAVGQSLGSPLYLVGGIVRDLLLDLAIDDLDIVVEGDALAVARRLARRLSGRCRTHPRFGTATLLLPDLRVDLATARAEIYPYPGALPQVKPGSLADDLARRDFGCNALAISLNAQDYGRLVDPCRGRDDLRRRHIRVLHDTSFRDDPTRLFRALRYEQRLGFCLEAHTAALFRRDLPWVEALSGERITHELDRILEESQPEAVLARMGELGLLAQLHPGLVADAALARSFQRARGRLADQEVVLAPQRREVLWGLLAFALDPAASHALSQRLKLRGRRAMLLRELTALKELGPTLQASGLAPSQLYRHLQRFSPEAVLTVALATQEPTLSQRLLLYWETLRHVKPSLGGEDLLALGVPPGPAMGRLLNRLQEACLDGRLRGEEEERRWLQEQLQEKGRA